jgi:hypothetical protein
LSFRQHQCPGRSGTVTGEPLPAPATHTDTLEPINLNREQVLPGVLEFVDAHGAAARNTLTLAEHRGVTAPALYRHVESRADLETSLAELVYRDLVVASDAPAGERGSRRGCESYVTVGHGTHGSATSWEREPTSPRVAVLDVLDGHSGL